MLDPTLIDEIDRNRRKFTQTLVNQQTNRRRTLDFTQPQPTADALANLVQISMNLSQRDHNLPFSSNIERSMLANLATNSDTYFYYGQISLEGQLKFLGLWNKNNNTEKNQHLNSIAASISNFVSGTTNQISNMQAASSLTVVDEVQNKTVNAFNSFMKVLTDDNDLDQSYDVSNSTSFSSLMNSSQTEENLNQLNLSSQLTQQGTPVTTMPEINERQEEASMNVASR